MVAHLNYRTAPSTNDDLASNLVVRPDSVCALVDHDIRDYAQPIRVMRTAFAGLQQVDGDVVYAHERYIIPSIVLEKQL